MTDLNKRADPIGPVSGHVARSQPGVGPAILVLHSWWGLTGHFRRVAERLAGVGYLAMAPDLYHGDTADDEAHARALRQGLNWEQALHEAVDALRYARELAGSAQPAGVIGFSMGAELAIDVATTRPADVGALVVFYGVKTSPALDRLRAPVQGHFAADDEFATADEIREFTSRLAELGVRQDGYVYAGTRHAFFNTARPEAYDPSSASLAWDRVVAFLAATLGPAAAPLGEEPAAQPSGPAG